jgi:gliding motility-associated-like protein
MRVNNPSVSAITNNTTYQNEGFVSSTGPGRLVWEMNTAAPYLFPTGSSVGTVRYRPIEIIPTGTMNVYGVEMNNYDATGDGFDVKQFTASLGSVNNAYYHRITRVFGSSPADVSFFYENTADGDLDEIAQWNMPVAAKWNDLGALKTPGTNYTKLTRLEWSDFNQEEFDLAKSREFIEIPNVFSPNNDGENETFLLRNNDVNTFHIKIFNRWGTLVFESESAEISWDGKTPSGVDASEGTYFYMLEYALKSGKKSDGVLKGHLQLVR